jgi:hypothetical protein
MLGAHSLPLSTLMDLYNSFYTPMKLTGEIQISTPPLFPTTAGFLSHLGDRSDSHTYNMHRPEAALPTVSLLGIVRSGGGRVEQRVYSITLRPRD